MEAGVLTNGVIERLNQLERRMGLSEDDRRDIWRHQGAQEKENAVINERLKSMHSEQLEQGAEIRWIRRGLWAAAGLFATLVVGIISLLAQGSTL